MSTSTLNPTDEHLEAIAALVIATQADLFWQDAAQQAFQEQLLQRLALRNDVPSPRLTENQVSDIRNNGL
ncbi:hypothetical protein GN958_ATG18422 [Phytophthora infestans]|uniref:Uncharacterized protein n=1 Tax=Phytophthora infestans TaxID=4787 RepID=A0A8S9TTY6_PHYIN|nr:hypothetical protein GN958_ATG18422 [Phytophthora infestans]